MKWNLLNKCILQDAELIPQDFGGLKNYYGAALFMNK